MPSETSYNVVVPISTDTKDESQGPYRQLCTDYSKIRHANNDIALNLTLEELF